MELAEKIRGFLNGKVKIKIKQKNVKLLDNEEITNNLIHAYIELKR